MSVRQRDTQIVKTAVKVTSQMSFKQRHSHCHTCEPSVSASMTERDWESEGEGARGSNCNVISESERGKGYDLCIAHSA